MLNLVRSYEAIKVEVGTKKCLVHTSTFLANSQEKPVALFAIYDGHFGTKHLAIKGTVNDLTKMMTRIS